MDGLSGLVRLALAEDVGTGDVTTDATVAEEARARAGIVQKAPGAIYGLDAAEAVFAQLDPDARCERLVQEGVWREGRAGAEGRGERPRAADGGAHGAELSGASVGRGDDGGARRARSGGDGGEGAGHAQDDPGDARAGEGGGGGRGASNHRAGLYDAILIKENHIAAAGGIAQAVARVRAAAPELAGTLEVEVRDAEEIDEALAAGAPRLLLDNMDDAQLRAAVAQVAGRAELEASGGVTLQTLRARAETGVEWVSMGALTHSAPALDLSLILEALP